MKIVCAVLVIAVLAVPVVAAFAEEAQGGNSGTATGLKQPSRRDVIAGQIYAAFISKYDVNAFKGGSFTVAGNVLSGDDGKALLDASIEAAEALILRLDGKWIDKKARKSEKPEPHGKTPKEGGVTVWTAE